MISETSGGAVQTVSSLETKENRKEWERLFSHHYIQPVLSTLNQSLVKAIDRVAKDEKQGQCNAKTHAYSLTMIVLG